jgi:hypothetical protein
MRETGATKRTEIGANAGVKKSEISASARSASSSATAGPGGGKMLPPDKVLSVNEGKSIPVMLEDIQKTINQNSNVFGPMMGRLSSLNPYDERAQTIESQMRAASQSFGRYMEGGVLRKEDEDKYRKMFPNLSDTPEVARNKLDLVDRQLKRKLAADIEALRKSGYDVGGLMGGVSGTPEVPSVIRAQDATSDRRQKLLEEARKRGLLK